MNPNELCICTHPLLDHSANGCSARFHTGTQCPCKEFAMLDAGVDIYEALKALLPYLPDRNDALNYAATNDGRVGNIHVAVQRAYDAIRKAKGETA